MTEWIETKDRLPEENSANLEFTDGRRPFSGYYQNGRFVAETPPDAGTGNLITWEPPGIIWWRQKGDDET